jgi:hypothetical protein
MVWPIELEAVISVAARSCPKSSPIRNVVDANFIGGNALSLAGHKAVWGTTSQLDDELSSRTEELKHD